MVKVGSILPESMMAYLFLLRILMVWNILRSLVILVQMAMEIQMDLFWKSISMVEHFMVLLIGSIMLMILQLIT